MFKSFARRNYTNPSSPNKSNSKKKKKRKPNTPKTSSRRKFSHNISHNLRSPGISPASPYFFSLSNTIGFRPSIPPLARYRIPEFDNRIWPPFAERAYVRSADMQMIAVGCIERDARAGGWRLSGIRGRGGARSEARSSADTWQPWRTLLPLVFALRRKNAGVVLRRLSLG